MRMHKGETGELPGSWVKRESSGPQQAMFQSMGAQKELRQEN